ncbi:DUF2306 domain-containing protein [Bacillus toyonensis]|uniref:DUF2306 domain-containing protein n=1 Tax=Bacillus toyonensis TaxID=155322 RepID=UPI001155C196|nr:DUF2306 domain-containing protein [Bacillus toyonensis]
MNRKIWFVVTFFALLVTGYVVVQYFIMDGFQTGLVKAKLMFGSKLSAFWYMMLFIHITTSIVALVIGPFTLSTRFRERNINRHRIVGRIYLVGVLLGGVSGLYLSFYATGGLVAKLGFGLLSVFWLTSAYQALHRVKNKKIKEHRNWMIRNYSLTFGAVTLRIWLPEGRIFLIAEFRTKIGWPIEAILFVLPTSSFRIFLQPLHPIQILYLKQTERNTFHI